MRKLNKKGSEIFSLWEIFMLIVIGGGIVIGVWIFYSADVDVRESEVDLLYEKIALCLNENGYLDKVYFENINLLTHCEINEKVITETGNFYIETYLTDLSNNLIPDSKKVYGNLGHGKDCQVIYGTEIKAKDTALCNEGKEIVRYEKNNEITQGYLVIKTSSNQRGGKIPIA